MAKWVECHSKSDKAVSVYVNLDLIASITQPHGVLGWLMLAMMKA